MDVGNIQARSIRNVFILLLTWVIACGSAMAEEPEVLGVIGMDPVEAGSRIAVYVPLDEGEAVCGIDWFNNDGTVAFPSVGVSGGTAVDPGSGSAAIVVASDVYGMSSAWSRFLWEETYECDAGGLYVILGLPYGSVHIGEGAGGGAAVGFVESDLGVRGWLSIDGEEWIPLQSSLGLAVRPILVAADFNTVLLQQSAKQLGTSMAEESGPEGMPQLRTAFSAPHPNPFNPAAKLSFTLSKAMEVELTVFDVRGQVVRRLIDGPYSAGEHQLSWDGRTGRGKAVGSGVYLARLKAGGYVQTHRLTLVR